MQDSMKHFPWYCLNVLIGLVVGGFLARDVNLWSIAVMLVTGMMISGFVCRRWL